MVGLFIYKVQVGVRERCFMFTVGFGDRWLLSCVKGGGHGSPKRLHRWEGEYRGVLKGGVQVGLNFTGGFKDVKCE